MQASGVSTSSAYDAEDQTFVILNVIAFVLGVVWLQQQAVLPSILWAYVLVLAAGSYFLLPADTRLSAFFKRGSAAAICFAAGFLWAALIGHIRLADQLSADWEGRDITVVGVVASLPQHHERAVRFELDVEHVLTPLARVPRHVSVTGTRTRTMLLRLCTLVSVGSSLFGCVHRPGW